MYAKSEEFTADIYNRFKMALWEQIDSKQIEEIKGASSLMNKLAKDKIHYCFATGAIHKTAIYKLDYLGIPYERNLVVASDEIHEREGIVQEAIDRSKKHYGIADYRRIISIGDGIWDLKTAQNLDLEFIGIGEKNKTQMETAGMKNFYSNMEEFHLALPTILNS